MSQTQERREQERRAAFYKKRFPWLPEKETLWLAEQWIDDQLDIMDMIWDMGNDATIAQRKRWFQNVKRFYQ